MESSVPRVGIGVFVFKNGVFLMGKRHGSHGHGAWSVPGGHLDFGESFEEAAKREVEEETGVKIKHVHFGAITNDYFQAENKHYITVWMMSDYASGTATIKEPDKFVDQGWYTFNQLPSPLFLPWKQLLSSEFIDNIKKHGRAQ